MKTFDRVIVVDLETTCWPDNDRPNDQIQDIIEIGWATLRFTNDLEIEPGGSILVKPTRSAITPFCTALTEISPDQVVHQDTLAEALSRFRRFTRPNHFPWASWGDFDRLQMERECANKSISYPFNRTHLNIQTLLSLAIGLNHDLAIETAITAIGLTFKGRLHSGQDDARNAARILQTILQGVRPHLLPHE